MFVEGIEKDLSIKAKGTNTIGNLCSLPHSLKENLICTKGKGFERRGRQIDLIHFEARITIQFHTVELSEVLLLNQRRGKRWPLFLSLCCSTFVRSYFTPFISE